MSTRSLRLRRSLVGFAVVALVCGFGWWLRRPVPTARFELQPLAAALTSQSARLIEPRLAGLVAYAPLRQPTRGRLRPEVSSEVWTAVAKLERQARERPTAANRAAFGAASLAVGECDKAVDFLEDAVQDEPHNILFQSDLSAAYLARAAAEGVQEDWARALAASERAIRVDSRVPEPLFNRALAMRGLHLPQEELAAWNAYLSVDPEGGWAGEAKQRVKVLRESEGVSDSETRDHQGGREEIEDRLLRDWAEATLAGDKARARRALDRAETQSQALVDAGGDGMPHDQIARLRRLQSSPTSGHLVTEAARGHRLYGLAREEFLRDNLREAAHLMGAAAAHFSRAGSAYRLWAPVYQAFFLRHQKKLALALAQLRTIPGADLPSGYRNLRGRLAWTEGVLLSALGRHDLAREALTGAIREFQLAEEYDNLISTQTILAEVDWFLGDPSRAWASLRSTLALVAGHRATKRNFHFTIGALMAGGAGLPEAALVFANARIRVSTTPRSTGEALLHRARLLASIGNDRAAMGDLDAAAHAFNAMSDPGLRDEAAADVHMARAELFTRTDCRRAIDHANAALESVTRTTHSIRAVGLLAIRARCHESLGDLENAKRDLSSAASVFETRRAGYASVPARIHAFEQEREAFKQLLTIEVVRLNDEAAGLRTAERARAGVLAEAWRPRLDATDPGHLPRGVAVVYYESLDDRVLMWVLTRGRRQMLTHMVDRARLRRMVGRIQREIARGAGLATLRPSSRELFETLIAPALELADRLVDGPADDVKPAVFFVPDGPLFAIPFGALPGADGNPLIRSRVVGVAPSLAAFLAASERLSAFVPADVLAIGDGSDPASSGLPELPHADREARLVGRLYAKRIVLEGPAATKAQVLRKPARVIHFAGHTIVNEQFPLFSHMLLAPNRADGDTGRLFASDITAERLRTTGVVVLATCEGAAGRVVEGEGALSVARAFFAAGVPAVVASMWPVPDDVPGFAVTLHRSLIAGEDAASALRRAQLALLDERGPATPVNVWGGYIMFGGFGPVS